MDDRRAQARAVQTYKPACLEADGKRVLAILRDLSPAGAGFEGPVSFAVGQRITYAYGSALPRTGTVIWAQEGRVGIAHDDPLEQPVPANRYRSVRVPFCAPAALFVNGRKCFAELVNIAQNGLCLLTDRPLQPGALATLEVDRHSFEASSIVWQRGDLAGIRFAKPVPLAQINAVLRA